jgi:hypothetical protein
MAFKWVRRWLQHRRSAASRDGRALGGRAAAGVQLSAQAVGQRQRELHAAGAAAHHSNAQLPASVLTLCPQRLRQELLKALCKPACTSERS